MGIVALSLFVAAPVRAFVLTQTLDPGSGRWYPERWSAETRQVPFVVHDLSMELLPNLTPESQPLDAVEAALQTWALAPPGFVFTGQASQTNAGLDGVDLITLADTPQNRDVVAGFNGRTLIWTGPRAENQPYIPIIETDIVISPSKGWATDGDVYRLDLQSTLTHELGHALGLSHTPILAATMYAYGAPGQEQRRVPDMDDQAGMRALYGVPADFASGTIAGKVLTTDGVPVFGAHVSAIDSDGVVQIGSLTDPNGSYSLPSLPPGDYELCAEPLDGPTTPANLSDFYHVTDTEFETAFAGGNRTPVHIAVLSNEITTAVPISVVPQHPSVIPTSIAWSSDGKQYSSSSSTPLLIAAGQDSFLVALGIGVDSVNAISASGSDLSFDFTRVQRGTGLGGYRYVILPVSVRAGARPGPRSLILDTGYERAVLTGAVLVSGS